MSFPSTLHELFATLRRRPRPEDVADLVLRELGADLSPTERDVLQGPARGSLRSGPWAFSSMSDEFARPVGMGRQLAKAAELFRPAPPLPPVAVHDDPEAVRAFVEGIGAGIGKTAGRDDFKADRLPRAARQAAGLGDLSRRRYNKLFRLAARLSAKRATLEREWQKREFAQVGKSRLAWALSWEEFAADRDSACLIAYLTARANLRSEFTIGGQQRAFDKVAAMLLARCRARGARGANWWAIAHALPNPEVVSRLTEEEKGRLLARWYDVLVRVAGLLESVWACSAIARATMIVARGNDSSTWNQTAGAWNKAREGWVTLLFALGMDEVVDAFCPGKVLRLMAADVVVWHRSAGNHLEADTAVWAELPLPWEVLSGDSACPRAHVEEVCRRHGVDPVKSGWTAPHPERRPVPFRPTPELVHGVTVNHPGLALTLRRLGFFSGKGAATGAVAAP